MTQINSDPIPTSPDPGPDPDNQQAGPEPSRGLLVAIEGIKGSGKTTQASLVTHRLNHQGVPAIQTKDPGGTTAGNHIRRILSLGDATSDRTELLLFAAARAELVDLQIKPALERGHTVVTDRFSASTYAFQGAGRGLNFADIQMLDHYATAGIQPDLYVLLHQPTAVGTHWVIGRRLSTPAEPAHPIENQQLSFQERVNEHYSLMAHQDLTRWLVIPADQQRPNITRTIVDEILLRLR